MLRATNANLWPALSERSRSGSLAKSSAMRRASLLVRGWIAAETNKWIKVRPTHWRVWPSPVKKLDIP